MRQADLQELVDDVNLVFTDCESPLRFKASKSIGSLSGYDLEIQTGGTRVSILDGLTITQAVRATRAFRIGLTYGRSLPREESR